ncbi:MAG: DEAD/DEAH box helicase [Candidatus Micrarchaeota archaeon]|nr:DEAD/DEAH box helicase [Candidatus Micrarchaeota archaeon]
MENKTSKVHTPISAVKLVNRQWVLNGKIIPLKEVMRDYVFVDDKICKMPNYGTDKAAHDKIEDEAYNKDISFNESLLQRVRNKSKEKYMKLRELFIANGEMKATNEDTDNLNERISKQNKDEDIWTFVKAFDFDASRIADAIRLRYPHLDMNADALYHTVTRLVTGKVRKDPRKDGIEDPLSDLKDFLRRINPGDLDINGAFYSLCSNAAQEKYLICFVNDPKEAFARLDADLKNETNGSVRIILEAVRAYYKRVDNLKINGAVDHFIDRETGGRMLFPSMHQKIGIEKILNLKRILIADEMGVGKTAQALLGFIELCNREPEKDNKALIICPASVIEHWRDEIVKCLTPEYAKEFEPNIIRSGNKEEAIANAKKARITIISYDMIIRSFNGAADETTRVLSGDSDAMNFKPKEARKILEELASIGYNYVTIDEVHRAKNPHYATHADMILSAHLREPGRKRILVCDEEDIMARQMDLEGMCNGHPKPPKIAAISNGSLDEVYDADIIITPRSRLNGVLEKIGYDKENDRECIIDEEVVDEIKDLSDCQRSAAVHKIVSSPKKGGAEYVVLLSGTPLPKCIEDIGNLASMLEPDKYESATVFNQKAAADPRVIKQLLLERMLRRRVDQVMELPEIRSVEVPITLSPEQRELYQIVQENEFNMPVYIKMWWTMMAATNPPLLAESIGKLLEDNSKNGIKRREKLILNKKIMNQLINLRELAARVPSAKFEEISRIAKDETGKGNKTVIFSSALRHGIIEPIKERLNNEGIKTVHIDGKVTNGENGGLRKETTDQFKDSKEIKALVATLRTMGEGISLTSGSAVIFLDYPYTDAERKQGIARVWRRGQKKEVTVYYLVATNTIDENAKALVEERELISRMIIDGIPLTEEQKRIYDARRMEAAGPMITALRKPREILHAHYASMYLRGGNSVYRYLKENEWKNATELAETSDFKWETSFAGNNARAVKEFIEVIEKKNSAKFSRIADLACGEATDLSVISLALHDTSPFPENGELQSGREKTIREALRILKTGGWLVISEPYTAVNMEGAEKLQEGLIQLGCEKDVIAGFITDAEDSLFAVFVLAVRKGGEPKGEPGKEAFVLNTENSKILGRRRGRKRKPTMNLIDGKMVEEFMFLDINSGRKSTLSGADHSSVKKATKSSKGGQRYSEEEIHKKVIERWLDDLIEMQNSGSRTTAYNMLDKLAEYDVQVRARIESKKKEKESEIMIVNSFNSDGTAGFNVKIRERKPIEDALRKAKDEGEKE